MTGLLAKWLINAAALFAAVRLVPGIQVRGTGTLFAAALAVGLLNTFLRPIISLLALPVTILTLGLFTLVVNGFIFALAAWFVPGFVVAGFGSAVGGALVFSLVSFLLNLLIQSGR